MENLVDKLKLGPDRKVSSMSRWEAVLFTCTYLQSGLICYGGYRMFWELYEPEKNNAIPAAVFSLLFTGCFT